MDPNELAAAVKQQQQGAGGAGGADDDAKRQEIRARRDAMLSSVLTPEAKERLDRIALVRPEKAEEVGNMILSRASRGELGEKVSEERLRMMLENISGTEKKASTKITIQRKRYGNDDDSDEEYDL